MRGAGGVEDEQMQENRITGSLAALAVVLALVVAGLFLIQVLRQKASLEDCLMAGRMSCGVVVR